MKAKVNRRGSVEIQQLATWKHQQNLEEIKMLKASTTGAVSAPAAPPSAANTPSKLSKLVARIQRTSNEVASPAPAPEKSYAEQGSAESRPTGGRQALFQPPVPIIAHHENLGKLTSAATAFADAANRNDFELLLKEKQHWLRTIHEDNTKMAAMLKVM
jgi:hypothetical protein